MARTLCAPAELMFRLVPLFLSCLCFAQPTQREQVLDQMRVRPLDPWPRSLGHIVYAIPGTDEYHKSYEEPGGAFSPYANTFGISFWIKDARNSVRATSDSLPLSDIHQSFVWTANPIPDLLIETSAYRAVWHMTDVADWRLDVTPKVAPDESLELVIRSVGPAGGPISSLQWTSHALLVNRAWALSFPGDIKPVAIGHEGDTGWTSTLNAQTTWNGTDGWGYARFRISSLSSITIHTSASATPAELPFQTLKSSLALDLPDPRFAASLNAQVANQMMALVSNETRPGEPLNYPLAWLRDGAYVIVSLARAGQLAVARDLALYLTAHDYFGGFGSEADAPGLSTWALEEVANRLHDPAFDSRIYPAVKRKELQIESMLKAKDQVRQPVFGPIVPDYRKRADLDLVASPASNGLIAGRMDWHQPLLFVNAVSYRGLLEGAELAARTGDMDSASHWRSLASNLRTAWSTAYNTPARDDDRTFISALWPTWIEPDRQDFERDLDARWSKIHKADGGFVHWPLWTYFDIAEAHQWLFERRPERTWDVVEWYWNHQTAPGFYTWWEGNREENTFGRWQNIRGWVHPTDVTPHYWTASEMLLLQLDMLAYVDPGESQQSLIIGEGIQAAWLNTRLSVRGVSTRVGIVDWTWKDNRVSVTVHGPKVNVILGSVFPTHTSLETHFE